MIGYLVSERMKLVIRKRHVFYCSMAIGLGMFLGTLLGCGGSQSSLIAQHTGKSDKSEEISQLNERLFASAQMNVSPIDDLIGSGDLLHVSVFEAKDLETKVRVNSRGYVTLPLLGQVLVKGLTAREAEEKTEDLYRKRYIKDPHVNIFIEESFSQRVTVVGQVRSPGTYDYLSKQRLIDVLALVGGLNDKAGRTVTNMACSSLIWISSSTKAGLSLMLKSMVGMLFMCRRQAFSSWTGPCAGRDRIVLRKKWSCEKL